MESRKLHSEHDPIKVRAGIDKLNAFGDFVIINKLANGDILKFEKVLLIDFYTALTKMQYDSEHDKFEKRYLDALKKD